MFHKIAPKVRVYLNEKEEDLLDLIQNSPDEQITKNSLNQEQLPLINLLLSQGFRLLGH